MGREERGEDYLVEPKSTRGASVGFIIIVRFFGKRIHIVEQSKSDMSINVYFYFYR